jgi:hypothetical protein
LPFSLLPPLSDIIAAADADAASAILRHAMPIRLFYADFHFHFAA